MSMNPEQPQPSQQPLYGNNPFTPPPQQPQQPQQPQPPQQPYGGAPYPPPPSGSPYMPPPPSGPPPQQPYGGNPYPYQQPPQQPGQPPYGSNPYQQQQQSYGSAPYQQPPYGGAPYPPQPSMPNRWGQSSIGVDPNIAAGIGYLIPIVGLIFFFVEKTNRFVKFHAAQATLIGIIGVALSFLDGIVNAALLYKSFGIATLFTCLFSLLWLGWVGLWIWGMVIGFGSKYVKMPVIGDIAERWAGGPALPIY